MPDLGPTGLAPPLLRMSLHHYFAQNSFFEGASELINDSAPLLRCRTCERIVYIAHKHKSLSQFRVVSCLKVVLQSLRTKEKL